MTDQEDNYAGEFVYKKTGQTGGSARFTLQITQQ